MDHSLKLTHKRTVVKVNKNTLELIKKCLKEVETSKTEQPKLKKYLEEMKLNVEKSVKPKEKKVQKGEKTTSFDIHQNISPELASFLSRGENKVEPDTKLSRTEVTSAIWVHCAFTEKEISKIIDENNDLVLKIKNYEEKLHDQSIDEDMKTDIKNNIKIMNDKIKKNESRLRWKYLNDGKTDLRSEDMRYIVPDVQLNNLLEYDKYKDDVKNDKIYTIVKYSKHQADLKAAKDKRMTASMHKRPGFPLPEIEQNTDQGKIVYLNEKRYKIVEVDLNNIPENLDPQIVEKLKSKRKMKKDNVTPRSEDKYVIRYETDPSLRWCTVQRLISKHIKHVTPSKEKENEE